jgi:hypothetical protein
MEVMPSHGFVCWASSRASHAWAHPLSFNSLSLQLQHPYLNLSDQHRLLRLNTSIKGLSPASGLSAVVSLAIELGEKTKQLCNPGALSKKYHRSSPYVNDIRIFLIFFQILEGMLKVSSLMLDRLLPALLP